MENALTRPHRLKDDNHGNVVDSSGETCLHPGGRSSSRGHGG